MIKKRDFKYVVVDFDNVTEIGFSDLTKDLAAAGEKWIQLKRPTKK